MNKYIKILIVLVILPVTVVATAFFVQTLTLDAQVSAQQTNLQQRIEQYKQKLQTQPSKSDLEKLKLRCGVSQQKLKAVAEKAGVVQEKRVVAYNSINKSLEELIVVLKEKNINTSTLEAQAKDLKSKTDTFAVDMTAYKQALEDASSSDCLADPIALKAPLEDARNYRVKLAQEVIDIRTYIVNVINISLKQTKDELTAQKATNSTTPTETQALPDATQAPANPTDAPTSTPAPTSSNQPVGGTNSATQ